jgi:hypothetical protein
MIQRRQFLAAGAALACVPPAYAAAASGVPVSGALAFRVCRNGSEIGSHTLTFSRRSNTLTVRIEADFRVHFGPITFYRYHHQGTEQWRDGNFAALDTETNDNGTQFEVHAARTTGGVSIHATNLAGQIVPPDTIPLTHWAVAVADARTKLFNPQTGALLAETLQPRGRCTVALADGVRIPATRVALAGAAPIDDFYDTTNLWAALDAIGKDGSHITYRRL